MLPHEKQNQTEQILQKNIDYFSWYLDDKLLRHLEQWISSSAAAKFNNLDFIFSY